MMAAVVSEMLVLSTGCPRRTVQLTDWNEASIYKISLEKLKFIENFKFEINCLNLFETPCARQYGAVPHKTTVLVRTLLVRWELEYNIEMENREIILGFEDYRWFQQTQRGAT
jgi:hypothetical protein